MKAFLTQLFKQAVAQSLPENCLPEHLKTFDKTQPICILGAGKAAVQMAQVACDYFGENCFGAVVTRHGYADISHIGNIEILYASHPIPDVSSMEAANRIIEIADSVKQDTQVLFLISGGGSALLTKPVDGLDFAQKIAINKFLLASGADIEEINLVRKQLSAIKGGKLAARIKGKHSSLIISDVVGDKLEVIASGPTIADDSTPEQAISILKKYGYGQLTELKPLLLKQSKQHCSLKSSDAKIVANAKQSIDKAIQGATEQGHDCQVIGYDITGNATEVARQHAILVKEKLALGKPCLLLSGGELTVKLNNNQGAGGPNQEYALALALALEGEKGFCALACDTDGVDGNKDVAGAYIDDRTIGRLRQADANPEKMLENNQSWFVFNSLNDLIITGPTHTNVNDFRVIYVNPQSKT